MRTNTLVVLILVASLVSAATSAELPVREVTIFKDGHALVLREGPVDVGDDGSVVLDTLPVPVLGTFWPYVVEGEATLASVTAGVRGVADERPVRGLGEVVEANVGRRLRLRCGNEGTIEGVVESMLGAPSERLAVVETETGRRVVPIGALRGVDVLDDGAVKRGLATTEERPYLRMDLDWRGPASAQTAVGCMYVQKGLRWIPGYRITLDGAGTATVELQATLVNELCDLDGVTAHLVIGVPSFAFEATPDPLALQDAIAPLGPYFDAGSSTGYALTNAQLLTQSRMGERRLTPATPGARPVEAPALVTGERAEDLFVFTLEDVTLAQGKRMVVPVATFAIPYTDVYKLDVPIAPPTPFWSNLNADQHRAIARRLERPRVRHAVRLHNASAMPITTAPALVIAGARVLAQGLLTYAAPGADVDLELTDAVDVAVAHDERETARVLRHEQISGDWYHLVRLEGSLTLTNRRDRAVRVEVTRFVLGSLDDASPGVTHTGRSIFSAGAFGSAPDDAAWWRRLNWPWWWMRVNGPQRLEWTPTLEPGAAQTITWRWHYLWR